MMPTAIKPDTGSEMSLTRKIEVIRIYYQLVKKGYLPEQTRKDLGLSFQDVEHFDFSIFNKAV